MSNSDETIGFLLYDVSRLMRRVFNRRVQDLGLSQMQWRALAHLSKQEGINQVTLADHLEIQPITLARLIDRLQEAGFVMREPDPNDRRALRLFLTDKAKPIITHLREVAQDVHGIAYGSIPHERRVTVSETLLRMKQNLAEADESGSANNKTEEKNHVADRIASAAR